MPIYQTQLTVCGYRVHVDCDNPTDVFLCEYYLKNAMHSPHINPVNKEREEIEIPPGWEPGYSGQYVYGDDGGKWIRCTDINIRRTRRIICQKINIDMDRQPPELVAWAMNDEEVWHGYTDDIPDVDAGGWWEEVSMGIERQLFTSEEPIDFSGSWEDWKDSLIVRPEHWNKTKGYGE